jgi:hypothetical protein
MANEERSDTLVDLLKGIIKDDQVRGVKSLRVTQVEAEAAPSNILISSDEVDDESPAGTNVGILTVVDANINDEHVLEITADPDDKFTLTESGGNTFLTLSDSVDFETQATHLVTIRATDLDDLFIDVEFTINVLPIFSNVYSFAFGGTDEYLEFDNPNTFHFESGGTDQPFSVAAWVKMTDATRFRIFNKGAVGTREYTFSTDGSDLLSFDLFGNDAATIKITQRSTVPLTLDEGSWVLLVGTYDGSAVPAALTLYRNGALLTSSSISLGIYVSLNDSTDPLETARLNGGTYSIGSYDELSVWDKELSLVEIQELYNSGEPFDIRTHSAQANIISWWRMGDDDLDDGTGTTGNIQDQIDVNHGTPYNTESGDITADVP